MPSRVYIETTIPSFYHTLHTDVESVARMKWTRRWWERFSGEFILTSSAAVITELRQGSGHKTQDRIDLLRGIELLEVTDEVDRIAQIYIDNLIMPRDPTGDALHLAVASFHKVDVLLTWNCAHIANANKISRLRLLNFEMGLPLPELTTPLNFLDGGD